MRNSGSFFLSLSSSLQIIIPTRRKRKPCRTDSECVLSFDLYYSRIATMRQPTTWKKSAIVEITRFGGLSRPELMSRIRASGNASTELRFLSLLRQAKLKGWRRNYPLFGKPDFTFPKERVVVFIDGCFWHAHGCTPPRKRSINSQKWKAKFDRNKKRDRTVTRQLRASRWNVVRIWECRLAKNPSGCIDAIKAVLSPRQDG